MTKKPKNRHQMLLRLDNDVWELLDRMADSQGVSVTFLINKELRETLFSVKEL